MDMLRFEITDDDVGVMEVRHPGSGVVLKDAAGNPVTVSMVSLDSPRYKAAQRMTIDKRLKDQGRSVAVSAESMEADNIETVALAVTGWSGIGIDSDETPCSFNSVCDAFRRLPWLFEQCSRYLGNRANFLPASAKD